MLIIGCDYHPGFQQIVFLDTETGALEERRLTHREEAERFYGELKEKNVSVRVGMEASGHSRWFERLLGNLEFELWIGDAAEIRTKRVRKQKTDRQDAQLLLRLLMEDRFPRIWVPDAENRDLRQLLWHRHRLVQMRTRVMDQLLVAAGGPGGVGIDRTGSLGKSAAPGPARHTGPAHTEDPGIDRGFGSGSGETSGDAAD
jgi:transposase